MLGAVSAHYYCYYYYYCYLTFSLPRHIPLPSFLQTVYILSSSSIAVTRFLHNNVTIKKIYCPKTEMEDGHIRCLIQAVARGSLLEGPVCLFRLGLGLFGGQADHCADRKHCLADHHVGTSVSIQSPFFLSCSFTPAS